MYARKFNRPQGKLQRKKVFILAFEGKVTEQLYFDIFKDEKKFPNARNLILRMLPWNSDTSPPKVLKRLKNYLECELPEPPFEAWLVVDRDNWTDQQLALVNRWTRKNPSTQFLALSNPKFEYWLLLHFEEGNDLASSKKCSDRLVKCPCGYNKNKRTFDVSKITMEKVENAVIRAKKKDRPKCKDWPRTMGNTTVYRLVEKILESLKKQ